MTQAQHWKERLRRAAQTVETRVPASEPLVGRAKVLARYAANLRRWTREDERSLRDAFDVAVALSERGLPIEPGTRSRVYESGAKRAICSYATGAHLELLSIAAPTYIGYGERHGWDVVLSTEEPLADGRPASWAKIPLIRELLRDYDIVWWIDADAIIVDPTVSIDSELDDDKDLFIVEHTWGKEPAVYAANAGVMIWRASEWSFDFLEQIWDLEKYTWHHIWENAAVLDLLGYEVTYPMYHRQPTKLMERVKYIPLEWNSVWPNPARTPRINHHGGGLTWQQRRERMLLDLWRHRNGVKPPPEVAAVDTRSRTYLTAARPAETMVREDIPLMLNQRRLVGEGVEVGVFAGQFSNRILSTWEGRHLISIDPWLQAPPDEYVDISNVDQDEHESLYEATRARLAQWGDRSTIWRTTSEEAAPRIPDASLDFVYIDARHDEASVREDLGLWFPKVRPGGIIAGHDYLDGELPEGRFGVKTAVDGFFAEKHLRVHVTGEAGFQSWIVEVP